MKNKNDLKFIYGLQKLATDFKNSDTTSNYSEIEKLLEFTSAFLRGDKSIEEKIFREVALLLSQLRSYPLANITYDTNLSGDLNMNSRDKEFLIYSYDDIIKFFGGSGIVSEPESIACNTVKDVVELLISKI